MKKIWTPKKNIDGESVHVQVPLLFTLLSKIMVVCNLSYMPQPIIVKFFNIDYFML